VNITQAPTAAKVTPNGIVYEGLYYSLRYAIQEDWYTTAHQTGEWFVPIVYENDTLYIEAGGERLACHLLSSIEMKTTVSNAVIDIQLEQYYLKMQQLQDIKRTQKKRS
jgi:hypothetical protein